MTDAVVRAAGGLVWREGVDGVEVVVVHRPRYEDWTFPKGKAEPDESDEACALREVLEETGLRCSLGAELPSATYTDRHGRPKVVRYWSMTVRSGQFEVNHEVDELRWVGAEVARALLTYARDPRVLDAFITGRADLPGTLPA